MKSTKFKFQHIIPDILMKLLMVFIWAIFLSACKNSHSTAVIDENFKGDGDNLPRVTQEMVPPI